MSKSFELSDAQLTALQDIVADWVCEGFTIPPYTFEQYDLFELLELNPEQFLPHSYDIRRPRLEPADG